MWVNKKTNFILTLGLGLVLNPIHLSHAANAVEPNAPKGKETPCLCNKSNLPVDQPNQSDIALLVWSNEAIVSTFSYNFVNYKNELKKASSFYSNDAWVAFMNNPDFYKLNEVQKDKLVVSAVATGAPIILQKGLINGVYTWGVQIPVLITYQSASTIKKDNKVVDLTVIRVPNAISSQGVAISEFKMVEAKKALSTQDK